VNVNALYQTWAAVPLLGEEVWLQDHLVPNHYANALCWAWVEILAVKEVVLLGHLCRNGSSGRMKRFQRKEDGADALVMGT